MPPDTLDLDNELDRAIELQDLRALVLAGQPLPAARYRKLIEAMQAGRESRARAAAASAKSGRKALGAQAPIDLDNLFSR